MKEQFVEWAERHIRMPIVGIDLSDHSMKYMKIRTGKEVFFEAFGEKDIPEGAIVGGEIKREDDVRRVIRECVAQEGRYFRGAGIAVSLPEEKSFLRPLRLKNVKREDVGNAIRWEIEAQIPLPADDLIFDYEIIESSPDAAGYLTVVLTAFPKTLVSSYLGVFKGAGLVPVALELESQAIARAILPMASTVPPRVIVDMGRTRTSFAIVAQQEVVFTTTIAVGGELLEDNIMKALGVGKEEAARIKKDVGLSKVDGDADIFSALITGVGALGDELQRTVQSYQAHAGHGDGAPDSIAEILLSGGDASLLGLDTYLSGTLHIPCRYGNPFAGLGAEMEGTIPPLPLHTARAYTAAIGLALRGAHESNKVF